MLLGSSCKMSNPAFETGEEWDSSDDMDPTLASGDGDEEVGEASSESTAGDGDGDDHGDGDASGTSNEHQQFHYTNDQTTK